MKAKFKPVVKSDDKPVTPEPELPKYVDISVQCYSGDDNYDEDTLEEQTSSRSLVPGSSRYMISKHSKKKEIIMSEKRQNEFERQLLSADGSVYQAQQDQGSYRDTSRPGTTQQSEIRYAPVVDIDIFKVPTEFDLEEQIKQAFSGHLDYENYQIKKARRAAANKGDQSPFGQSTTSGGLKSPSMPTKSRSLFFA